MNPAGPMSVGQSTALKLIFHNPLPLCGGRRARSPIDFKEQEKSAYEKVFKIYRSASNQIPSLVLRAFQFLFYRSGETTRY